MKYVIKFAESCPEGAHLGTMYYLAETEAEMERFLNAYKDRDDYISVTCLGPITKPSKFIQEIISSYA